MNNLMEKKLEDFISEYQCTSEMNNSIHKHFTEMISTYDYLLQHRTYIENNRLGYGDRAFHYMWFLLLEYLLRKENFPKLLEIGVYKGQVVSLWSLIMKHVKGRSEIVAISPLEGEEAPKNIILFYWHYLTSKKFRLKAQSGNFYEKVDYLTTIESLFRSFDLDFESIRLHKGLSSDKVILSNIADDQFDRS